MLGLLGAAIVATTVSGIGGTLGFVLFHDGSASIFVTWQEWFASYALGIITIAPLVIGLASAAREPPARSETIEGLIALASLIVMSVIVIALPPKPWTTVVPIALLFPVLLWIAARCRPVFVRCSGLKRPRSGLLRLRTPHRRRQKSPLHAERPLDLQGQALGDRKRPSGVMIRANRSSKNDPRISSREAVLSPLLR